MHESILTSEERALLLGMTVGDQLVSTPAATEPTRALHAPHADRAWSSRQNGARSDEESGRRLVQVTQSSVACTRAQWDLLKRYLVRLERPWAEVLRPITRTKVAVRLVRLEQLTFGQLQMECPPPTFFAVFGLAGLDERGGWQVDLRLLRMVIERWLGGNGAGADEVTAGLTETENRLATRLLQSLASVAARSMPGATGKAWELEQQVARLDRVRAWSSARPMAVAEFEVVVGDCDGTMRVALPLEAITQIFSESANDSSNNGAAGADQASSAEPRALVVSLLPTSIERADVESLQVGDIVLTDHPMGQPLLAEITGELPMRVQLAIADGNLVLLKSS